MSQQQVTQLQPEDCADLKAKRIDLKIKNELYLRKHPELGALLNQIVSNVCCLDSTRRHFVLTWRAHWAVIVNVFLTLFTLPYTHHVMASVV